MKLPMLLLIIGTMAAIALFVQIDSKNTKTRDLRAKAYQVAPSGVRIESEEMTITGAVTKDAAAGYIQFGQ